MDRTPTEADRTHQQPRLAAAMRYRRRPHARAKAARRGQAHGANAVAGLGMIVTLLMIWAMAVHL